MKLIYSLCMVPAIVLSSCNRKEEHGAKYSNPLSFEALYSTATSTTKLTGEAADRIAIRTLIDAWAHCADRRLAKQQSQLFTAAGMIEVYQGDPAKNHKGPVSVQHGQVEIEKALGVLNRYDETTHMMGQSTISINGNEAIGETYGIAYQTQTIKNERVLSTLYIRYMDEMTRIGERWLFYKRKLIIDWSDTRPSRP